MKATTTDEQFISIDPFIFNASPRFIGPVLFTLPKSKTAAPQTHSVTKEEDGVWRHRLVWADFTGVTVRTPMERLPKSTVRLLYDAARPEAEDIERFYHGTVEH